MSILGSSVRRWVPVLAAFAFVASACGSGSVFDSNAETDATLGGPVESTTVARDATETDMLTDPGPNPATINYSIDTSAATTATIGAGGGTVSTTRDGVEMTLIISEDALPGPTEIMITPVYDAVSDLVELTVGGAEFSPAGLLLAKPAVFRLKGTSNPDSVMAVTWDESGGEVVSTMPLPDTGDGIEILIGHFSGAGAGSPGQEANSSSPRSQAERGVALIAEEWNKTDRSECVAYGSPATITAVSYYIAAANEQVIPALKRGQSDDLTLIAAIQILVTWWALPETLSPFLVCDDVRTAYNDVRMRFSDEIGERLKAGFVHAVFEASRQCLARSDRGELKNIVGWAGRAQLLSAFPPMARSGEFRSLVNDAAAACALYRVELRTQLTMNAGKAGSIRGTIAATAEDVPDFSIFQLLGLGGETHSFPFNAPSYKLELPPSSAGCVFIDDSTLNDIDGSWLDVAFIPPERKIPGISSEARDTGQDVNNDGATLVTSILGASGSILVDCKKRTFPMPFMATLVPQWFNGAHIYDPPNPEDGTGGLLKFRLLQENRGTLVASYTSDEPIVDPTDRTAKVEQHTEIKVFHTPRKMSRQEPPPPPDEFP